MGYRVDMDGNVCDVSISISASLVLFLTFLS